MADVFREFYTPSVAVPQILPTNQQVELPEGCINSACCEFNKGYTPPPFLIVPYPNSNGLRVIFEENPFNSTCVCQIECVGSPDVTPPGMPTEQFCPANVDHIYDIDLDIVTEGLSIPLLFTFEDQRGNTSTIDVNSIVYVKPSPLLRVVQAQNSYYYVEIGIPFTSSAGADLRSDIYQYQVQRYIGNQENIELILDWTKPERLTRPIHILHRRGDVFGDTLRTNIDYGYRVRYRTFFDEASLWSDWITARAPDDVQTS